MGQLLERILYVEDEPDIHAMARLALEHLGGFTVEVCSSDNEVLSKITAYTPDLILLDVMMSGMDGPTTLAELRKLPACAATPVVFMIAKVQPREVAHYLSPRYYTGVSIYRYKRVPSFRRRPESMDSKTTGFRPSPE